MTKTNKPSKNELTLKIFTAYCTAHPEERFWQALRNFNQLANPKQNFILTAETNVQGENYWKNEKDTFYEN